MRVSVLLSLCLVLSGCSSWLRGAHPTDQNDDDEPSRWFSRKDPAIEKYRAMKTREKLLEDQLTRTPTTHGKPFVQESGAASRRKKFWSQRHQQPNLLYQEPDQFIGEQNHYEVVRRYAVGGVGARLAVSPDGQSVAIAPGGSDRVIVFDDVHDASTERVVHLGKSGNPRSAWSGYSAREVAWCGGDTPTLYIAAGQAMWALDVKTLTTLPGWPLQRDIWGVICLADGAAATAEGSRFADRSGFVTVFERDGSERFSSSVHEHPPAMLALTNEGLIASESKHGIVLLDPNTGTIEHEIKTVLGVPLQPGYHFGGHFATAPNKPKIAIDMKTSHGRQPLESGIPEFEFVAFADIDRLREQDRLGINKHSEIRTINRMNYSRDGRDLLVLGQEVVSELTGTTNVVWILCDGKLYDTLMGQTHIGSDVKSLSGGRIITAYSSEIFIWAPKNTPR